MKKIILLLNDNTMRNELWKRSLEADGTYTCIPFIHPNYLISGMGDVDPSTVFCILFDEMFSGKSYLQSSAFQKIKDHFKNSFHVVSAGLIREGEKIPGFTCSVGHRPVSSKKLEEKLKGFREIDA